MTGTTAPTADRAVTLPKILDRRWFDWIWHIRGTLSLPPGQSNEEVFGRLEPLFREPGTQHDRASDALTFEKHDPRAQDKMAVFHRGELHIDGDQTAPVLRYDLKSKALLACFLAPFLFLAFAQVTLAIGELEKSQAAAAKTDEKKEEDKPLRQLHPIDQALGAPAPEKPKKPEAQDENPRSPTPAYVFAGLFALLYGVGRVLEARQVRRLFMNRLAEA